MNYRHVFFVTIAVTLALLIISFALFQLDWFSSNSNLTLYLRCGESSSGTLSVAVQSENGESNQKEESFDLKTVCQRGQIDFPDYLDEENLQVVFHSHESQTVEVIAE